LVCLPHSGSAAASPASGYSNLLRYDMSGVLLAQSQHCDTITDAGCPAAAGRVIAPLQAWLNDLNRASTPGAFTLVDLQLRSHVAAAIAVLNALVAAYHGQDQAAMTTALKAAVDERDMIEIEVDSIVSSQTVSAKAYRVNVEVARKTFDGCGECLPAGVNQLSCQGAQRAACATQVSATRYRLEESPGVASTHPPSSLPIADVRLRTCSRPTWHWGRRPRRCPQSTRRRHDLPARAVLDGSRHARGAGLKEGGDVDTEGAP
jgi:hypothetical protein